MVTQGIASGTQLHVEDARYLRRSPDRHRYALNSDLAWEPAPARARYMVLDLTSDYGPRHALARLDFTRSSVERHFHDMSLFYQDGNTLNHVIGICFSRRTM